MARKPSQKSKSVRRTRAAARTFRRKYGMATVAMLPLLLAAIVRCGTEEVKATGGVSMKPRPATLAGAGTRRNFRAADLKKLIDDKQISTIDALLEAMPAFTRENYVFLERSRSPQKGAPDKPRAIVYSQDSKFIFAFNDEHSKRGNDDLEVIEFNDETNQFEFSIFSETGTGKMASLLNVNDCVGCHQLPQRPNWESYPEWPGAWGSDQDLLLPDSTETKNLTQFLAQAPGRSRYKHLLGLSSYAKTRQGRYKGDVEGGDYDYRMVGRPNARFTDELFVLNAKRVATQIKLEPEYDTVKWALAATALHCGPVENYLPPGIAMVELEGKIVPRKSMAGIPGAKIIFKNGLRRQDYETHPTHDRDVVQTLLIGQVAKTFDLYNWSMTYSPAVPFNFRGSETKFTHIGEIANEVMRRDPDLKDWVSDYEKTKPAVRAQYCKELNAAFAKAFRMD